MKLSPTSVNFFNRYCHMNIWKDFSLISAALYSQGKRWLQAPAGKQQENKSLDLA